MPTLWGVASTPSPYPLDCVTMARYVGPCARCGEGVDRIIRAGRERLCVECAIAKHEDHCRTMADGTNPYLEHSRKGGEMVKHAIETRNGHIYEKWRNNIIRGASGEWD